MFYRRVISVFALLFFATAIFASDGVGVAQTPEPLWGVHVFVGASSGRTSLGKIAIMPWSGDYGSDYLVAAALSRRFLHWHHLWLEAEAGTGFRFPVNSPEDWLALYLRYTNLPWNRYIYSTIAINTGVSIVGIVSDDEKRSGRHHHTPEGARLLHYLGPEITFALPSNHNQELVFRIHHRSGVFGFFGGVWGASNVVTLGLRYRF